MTKRKMVFLVVSIVSMGVLLTSGLFGQTVARDNIYRHLSIFTEVFALVRSSYVEEVPSQKLVDGAFTGVSDAIDEASYYVPPGKMSQYKARKNPDAIGLGVVLSKRFGYGVVVAPVIGSPAAKAGVEAGDILEEINGKQSQNLAAWEMREELSGSKPASITVLRSGMSKREKLTLTPAPFKAPVPSLEKIGSVHLLKVPYFEVGTAELVKKQLGDVATQNGKKLLLDLRGNAGGSYDEAIATVDMLVSKGRIASTMGRRVEAKVWDADAEAAFTGELIVLVDPSVSGPAEIVAAALHGGQRARVVGLSTNGNTAIQKFVTLPSGGGLNVTIGNYAGPDGKIIGDRGVRPDVLVDISSLTDEEEKNRKDDLILQKGLSLFGESKVPAESRVAA